jgi:hypothetical protein
MLVYAFIECTYILDYTIVPEMFPNVCNHQPCDGRAPLRFCNQWGMTCKYYLERALPITNTKQKRT